MAITYLAIAQECQSPVDRLGSDYDRLFIEGSGRGCVVSCYVDGAGSILRYDQLIVLGIWWSLDGDLYRGDVRDESEGVFDAIGKRVTCIRCTCVRVGDFTVEIVDLKCAVLRLGNDRYGSDIDVAIDIGVVA